MMARGSRPTFRLEALTGLAGDSEREQEWRRLFEHFQPRLVSYFARRVDSEDQLDELTSEIWRRLLLNIHKLKSTNAFWSWMLQVGRNILADWGRGGIRMNGRQVAMEELTASDAAALITPFIFDGDDGSQDIPDLVEALAQLPAEDRALLELIVVDDMSHADVAIRLRLDSAAACRKRLQRIKAKLRERILGPGDE